MLYIKKFNNDTEKSNYIKSNFVSPHLFLETQNKSLSYLEKYKRLDYISSTKTGGQYIDLGCHLMENTDDIRIDIKFNIKDRGLNSSNQQGALLCSQIEVNPYPGFVLRYQNPNSQRLLQLQAKWNFTGSWYANNKGVSKYLTYNTYSSLDNNIYEFSETLDKIPTSQVNNCTCTLFCALDGSNNPFRYVEADLYYLKLTKGNTVIRNLIPVQRMSDNEVGLYDLENQVFYTSQSNESFEAGYAGDDIIYNISYLESTGNQVINSGITPSMDIDFEIKFSCNEIPTSISNGVGTIFGSRYRANDKLYQLTTYTRESLSNIGHFAYGSHSIFNYGNSCPHLNLQANVIQTFSKNGLNFTYSDGTNFTLSEDNFTYDQPISIFALNERGGFAEYISMKLYYLKFWSHSTGALLRDFIPVRKNEIGYLYDKVSETLFEDQKCEDKFTLGPDI